MQANDNFTFKPVEEHDLQLLFKWFREPHVEKWWPIPKEKEDFFNSFLKRIRSTKISSYIILLNDKPIGYIQSYPVDRSKETWLPELPGNTIGIDQFIGEKDYIGKGLGTLFIKEFVRLQQINRSISGVIVDPEPDNIAAIRCYEKVGFIKMGEYRRSSGSAALVMFRELKMIIKFEKASLCHKGIILAWLDKPHVKEFWDNSPEHRDDIVIFMNGRKEPSGYFNDIFTYWVGSIENELYCLVMTAEAAEVTPNNDFPQIWKDYLSKTGSTYSIDFCIGNEKYLGKGLAAPTLEIFTKFFQQQIDKNADTFFIDPDEDNPRAKHVYEKAGFKTVGNFVMDGGYYDGNRTFLMVKKM